MKALFDYLKPITQKIDAKRTVPCTSELDKNSSKKITLASTLLLSAGTILGVTSQQAVAQTNPSYPNFDQRYNVEIPGNLEAIGNASVICDRNNATCADGLANGTVGNNNGGLPMQMLDIDSDGSTFNSSSAQLNLPVGANIRFAALYWGGSLEGFGTTAAPNISAFNQISLQTPTSGAYQTITADDQNDRTDFGQWRTYGAFADITTLVQDAGNGTYTVANVQSNTGAGFTYPNAGWSIVVVYEDPAQPVRNISIFDGHDVVRNSLKTFNLTGLRTPPTPGFDVFMGAIANDGETDQPDDFLHINNNNITDALNPANNFFNGTISKFGSHITSRTPNDRNNMVIDIDYLDLTSWNQANNAIPTNATSIDLTLESQGDGIWPLAYFFAVQVFEPNLVARFEKTTPSTSYANGDVIPYTISVTNTGNDNATDTVITDAIPTGTTFVPGSLKIGGVTKTDGAGDDEAEFDGSNVIFRVGTGANATQGGQVNINDTVTMTFDVTVTAAPGDLVCNQATIAYEGQTSGNAGSGNSDDPNTPTFGDCTEVTTTASAAKDYGDAPDTYGTTDASGGPSHIIVAGLHLGTTPDSESDAETPLDGSGDGAEDDGITLTTLTEGDTSYTIPAGNITATGTGTLHGWVDFDKSGTFEPGEYTSVAVTNGTPAGDLSWNSITAGAAGDTYARFRFTSDASINNNTPGGAASDGEVEDYQVAISTSSMPPVEMCTIVNDITFVPLPEEEVANGLLGWPTATGTSTRTYTNVNGSGLDIRATTYTEDGTALTNQVSFLQFAGSLRKGGLFRAFAPWQLSLEFFETGTTIPAPVSGIQHVLEDFEAFGGTAEQVGNFAITPVGGSSTLLDSTTEVSITETYSGTPPIIGNFFRGYYSSGGGPQPDKWAILEAAAGQTYTRIDVDLQNGGGLNPILNLCRPAASDAGDAPISYGDARHTVTASSNVYLGNTAIPDIEFDTPNSANGGTDGVGDDNAGIDDENGVTVPASIEAGATISLPVTVTGSGSLNAWIDWDGSGTFDSGEEIATDVVDGGAGDTDSAADGTITLSVTALATATVGNTYARFRYSSNTGLPSSGNATDGEVEDYQVEIAASSFDISGTLYVDSNENNIFENPVGGSSEAVLPENITVRLLSSDGTTELATTVTDINGFYSFPNLAPDTYQVAVETTDPDIPVGLNIGTTTPLTIVASSTDATDQDFGFDLMTTGAGVSFCENPNGEVYSGGISNDIYGIYPPTGATFRITSSALAGVVNSLATDHVNRVVYYAEGQAIYAWDPINDTHVRLQDSSGNSNVSSMLGGGSIASLTSGGGAFYSGALYLGIERSQGNSDTDVYRVDFVPGSNGLTIQSLTALGVNDNTGGANGGLNSADWGDLIISDTGIIYGATRNVGTWSFNLSTSTYNFLSSNYLGQLAKDGNGTIWGLSDTGRIQEVDVNTGSLFGPSSPTSSAIADMGECVVGFSTIGDRVWDDLDGDGAQDTLEPGIANVTVGLYRDLTGNGVIDGSDPLLTTQATNTSGNYDFVDLIPGTYIVRILEGTANDLDGTNILDGSVLTTTSTPGGQQAVNLPLGIVDYDDADFGYQLPVIPQNPNVLLVKRITQINNDTVSAGGDDLAGYINQDDVTNPYDDNDITVADPVNPTDPPKDTDQWPDPSTSLIGGIDGGNVMPNDEIEYTIYYLSSGDATAESVLFCDYVPTFTSFMSNGYNGSAPQATGGIGGADLSIELFHNGGTNYHTGANDGDSATYFAPGTDPATSFPGIDCDGDSDGVNANPNGAVVVNLGDLPDATTDAIGAYGYVRFRTRVR